MTPGQGPDVIFIGYKRSGSTFLRNYFSQHPGIFWAREGHYFLSDKTSAKDDYYSRFVGARDKYKCIIDVHELLSVGRILKSDVDLAGRRFKLNYRIDGHCLDLNPAEVACRIKETVPEAKILYCTQKSDRLVEVPLFELN